VGADAAQNAGCNLKRYYRNNFTDAEKQQATDFLMGGFLQMSLYNPRKLPSETKWELKKLAFTDASSDAQLAAASEAVGSDTRPFRFVCSPSEFDKWLTAEERRGRQQILLDGLRAKHPHAAFVLTKSGTTEVLVFEGRMQVNWKRERVFDPQRPLDAFWLVPDGVEATPKHHDDKQKHQREGGVGVVYLRRELSMLERTYDYGYGVRHARFQAPADFPPSVCWLLNLALLPNRPLYLQQTRDGHTEVLLQFHGELFQLIKLHVASVPRALGPEKITDIFLHLRQRSTEAVVIDRIHYV
jgi:hypothetical protein